MRSTSLRQCGRNSSRFFSWGSGFSRTHIATLPKRTYLLHGSYCPSSTFSSPLCLAKFLNKPTFPFYTSISLQFLHTTSKKEDDPFEGIGNNDVKALGWKKLSATELGVSTLMIDRPVRVALNGLKREGYEVYLVGGCVRDLILKKTPKEFHILTSAELEQVASVTSFSQCDIVGSSFPVCHVHVDNAIVEVSSLSTAKRKSTGDLSYFVGRPAGCSEHDYRLWRNCMGRDFTINGLMFDPYTDLIYDYVGGLEDIKKAKVRTVMPACISFHEDCVRMLRAIRIAARLGFNFTTETTYSMKAMYRLVSRLHKGKLLKEMDYMLAFGSAEASLRLLWKIGLLKILLPIQASYFVSQGFQRHDKRSNMLLSLFANLDKILAPRWPCHSSIWFGILAFHKALVDHPKDLLVVATFLFAVYNGGDLLHAVNRAKMCSLSVDPSYCEILHPRELHSDETLMHEVVDLAVSVKTALNTMMGAMFISGAMKHRSDKLFIPADLYTRVWQIFCCVRDGEEFGFIPQLDKVINYENLRSGELPEVRYVFSSVVLNTIHSPDLTDEQEL